MQSMENLSRAQVSCDSRYDIGRYYFTMFSDPFALKYSGTPFARFCLFIVPLISAPKGRPSEAFSLLSRNTAHVLPLTQHRLLPPGLQAHLLPPLAQLVLVHLLFASLQRGYLPQ